MSTLAIIPTQQTEEQESSLNDYLVKKFANSAYQLQSGQWFVVYAGTSRQFSEESKISEGEFGSVIVLNTAGYWGNADKGTWEWLAVNDK